MIRVLLSLIVITAVPAFAQTPAAANAKYLERVRASIKGREQDPAGVVFRNVHFLKDVPADRLLLIMDAGYSRALGVTCTHCHDDTDFAADTKRPKRAAREMQTMHKAFNDQLRVMNNALRPADERSINCTTCHRGQAIPQ
jgi:hypothetical protein